MTSELSEEQLEYARAAARRLPPMTPEQLARIEVLNARENSAERERRMQAAYVATMRKTEPTEQADA